MSDITLRQLEYFVAVCESGSVSAGAERSHVSQSAMSAALAGLERALGTDLLQRHRRGVTLTPGGAELLARIRSILAEVDDLHTIASDIGGALSGPLRVGCYSTLAPALMPKTIEGFVRHNPDVALSFFEGSDMELLSALSRGECELVITYDYAEAHFAEPNAMNRIPLTGAPPKALVPTEHPLAEGPVSLADLAIEPLILLDLYPSAEYFLKLFVDRGHEPIVRFRSKSNQLVMNLVAEGLGCAVLTQLGSGGDVVAGGGATVKAFSDDLPALPIVAFHPAGVRLTRRARTFLDSCRVALGATSEPDVSSAAEKPARAPAD